MILNLNLKQFKLFCQINNSDHLMLIAIKMNLEDSGWFLIADTQNIPESQTVGAALVITDGSRLKEFKSLDSIYRLVMNELDGRVFRVVPAEQMENWMSKC